SERPAIQTSFNTNIEDIKEIEPGCALIIRKNGKVITKRIQEEAERKSCSFERIYFSRGNDMDIYKERKELGRLLCPAIFESVNYDLRKTVFSFIPNTAETAFYGMIDGVNSYLNEVKKRKIVELGANPDPDKLEEILSIKPNIEKIAIKDAKLRTFIINDEARDDMVAHIYDITYGTIEDNVDNLVVIDDSIVRGTTLKKSIIKILDRLSPKKIIVASSAPQIRYPDCYGIDMAKLGDFIAFRAAIELLRETLQENIMDDVYEKCKVQEGHETEEYHNYVKEIYRPFTVEQISNKISELLVDDTINAEVDIIFQSLEGLHSSIPNHTGDWYFSGDYPTPGGNKVVSRAFINFMEGKNVRAY
ncbi:MAG: amidophosphoribosyltransferase, partial [Bacteroidetes bacterium]|nr:amidophosphoribosyltransferase [Bacteroidota bacterium]